MVFGSLVAGAAATSVPMNLYSYNREAWMNDVQVRQNVRLQKQQLIVSKADMWREDIRDLIASCLVRQGNFVILSTLLIGVVAEAYIEGPLPDGVPEYLSVVYYMCIGSALLYMFLSTLCALGANHLAAKTQSVMLTTWVRLPVEELVQELDTAQPRETVEAFEHQRVASILRVPGVSRLTATLGSAQVEEGPGRRTGEVSGAECQNSPIGNYPSETMEQMEVDRQKHMRYYRAMESDWDNLGANAVLFGALGIHNLLQGLAYFSAAKYFQGAEWSSWIVQFLVTLADAFVLKATDGYLHRVPCGSALSSLSAVSTQLFCGLALRLTGVIDRICVPICFCFHLITCLLGFIKLHQSDVPPVADQSTSDSDTDDSGDSESSGDKAPPRRARRASKRRQTMASRQTVASRVQRYRDRRIVILSVGIMLVAWAICLGWAIYHSIMGTSDDGVMPVQRRRRLLSHLEGAAPAAAPKTSLACSTSTGKVQNSAAGSINATSILLRRELPVAWPSRHFHARSLSCAGPRSCFVASEFLIYELQDSRNGSLQAVRSACRGTVGGAIMDVSLSCNDAGACRPQVLSRDPPNSIIDCGTEEVRSLLKQELQASKLAAGAAGALFTLSGSSVLQYSAMGSHAHSAWEPLWSVAEVDAEDVVALGAIGQSGLLVFDRSGSLLLLDRASGSPCSKWALHSEEGTQVSLVAGSPFFGVDTVRVVTEEAGRLRLWEAQVPGLVNGCARSRATAL